MDEVEAFLAHFGVKGMKWGVRDGTVSSNASSAEKKAAKKESKLAYKDWKKEVRSEKVANEIFRTAAKSAQHDIKLINNDPIYKGKDLKKDKKLARDYDATVATVFNQHLGNASVNRTITNTGLAMIYQFDRSTGHMRATESKMVSHADDSGPPEFLAEMDELGHIISLRLVGDDAEHSDGTSDAFLEHFGIKGMKWGVKKAPKPEASADSKAVAESKALVKAGGTKALSTKDLQAMVNRMNLEAQYAKLKAAEPTKFTKGKAIVKEILGLAKTAQEIHSLLNSPLTKDFRKKMNTPKSAPKSKPDKPNKEGPVKGTLTINRELN